MDLIFNAECLRPPLTGVGYYSFHLLREFVNGSLVDDVHCFTGSSWHSGEAQLAATQAQMSDEFGGQTAWSRAAQHARTLIGYLPGTKPVYHGIMNKRFRRFGEACPNSVYHETNYILKPHTGPCVTTVHDLSHIRHPEFHKPGIVDHLGRLLPASLERADHIITVSNVVRDELLEEFDLPGTRVTTIYEGVEERYHPRSADECATVLDAHGLSYGRYVLFVATLEPRKGVDVLLDAWEQLPATMRGEFPLVMAGSSGWRNEEIRSRIDAFVEEGSVKYLGYVDADILPQLFSGAAVFTYPSVYEGFGLPVLDAMSSAIPVICRAGTSMAEFSSGSCVLCEGGSPEELATNLSALLESADERKRWGDRGRLASKEFSWSRCAAETAEIYRAVL